MLEQLIQMLIFKWVCKSLEWAFHHAPDGGERGVAAEVGVCRSWGVKAKKAWKGKISEKNIISESR